MAKVGKVSKQSIRKTTDKKARHIDRPSREELLLELDPRDIEVAVDIAAPSTSWIYSSNALAT